MASPLRVTSVRTWPGSWRDVQAGLLAYLEVTFAGGLIADGLTLRRSLDDRLYVSFPSHRDRHDNLRPILRPADAEAQRAIEQQVLAHLEPSFRGGAA